jgi:transcriptional regulator with XRE-family HTH domain
LIPEAPVSHFARHVKRLRTDRGLSLELVAHALRTHKGYISGIENHRVNPPSIRLIRRYARLFRQDLKLLVRLAWIDKAPDLLRDEAEQFLEWSESRRRKSPRRSAYNM